MESGTRATSSAFDLYGSSLDSTAVDKRAMHREPVFYFFDSRRVPLRESWWGSPAYVPIAALFKLLRFPVRGPTDDPNVESLVPFERPVEDVPADVAQRFVPLLRELEQLGFHSPIWHVIEDDLQPLGTYLATLQGDSGCVWARAHLRVWTGNPPQTKLYCELVSELRGGAFLWSLSSKPDLEPPPACTVLRDVGATPSKLLERHLAELRLLGVRRVVQSGSTDALRASAERHHAVVRDFHLARGVFAPLTAEHRRDLSVRLEIDALDRVGDDSSLHESELDPDTGVGRETPPTPRPQGRMGALIEAVKDAVIRVVRAAACIVGAAFLALGWWGSRSDPAARAFYLASPSCTAEQLKAPVVLVGNGGCSIEQATIVKRDEYDVRQQYHVYRVRVSQSSGRVEDIKLGRGAVAQRFWLRQKPGGSVRLQRFVAPGYQLTGRVTGIADDQQALTSLGELFPRGHPNGVAALIGIMMLLAGIFGRRVRPRR